MRAMFMALMVAIGLIAFPSVPETVSLHSENEAQEWAEFHADAYAEYADEFTALFNSLEFKRAKNGAPMIRRTGESTYRFVARGRA
jgi:hypothetical protein